MRNFLVPTDLSENALKTIDFIGELNKSVGGTITLVHAYRMPKSDPLGMAQATYSPKDILPELQDAKEELLKNTISYYQEKLPGFEWSYVAQIGFPAEVILNVADEVQPDVIAMGPAGILGFFKAFKGNTTSHVVEKAKCPVLVVPSEYDGAPITKMIYATDLERENDVKINAIKKFAIDYGIQITLLHIFELDLVRKDDLDNRYRKFLEQDHEIEHLKLKVISNPEIVDGIIEEIDRQNIDMVALIRTERTFLEKLFESSTTMKMTRHTKVPLLIYHE